MIAFWRAAGIGRSPRLGCGKTLNPPGAFLIIPRGKPRKPEGILPGELRIGPD
jgi:hypothetical protein